MSRLTRLWQRLYALWPKATPPPRPRRLRAVCEVCGKDLAVIATTGRLWSHRCLPPADEGQS